jgi:transcriptional antiterminator NusG
MTFASDDFQQNSAQEEQSEEASAQSGRWYAVQVASGCEKRVKANLEQRIETLDVVNRIFQIEIPQTPAIRLRKDGSRQNTEEKYFLATCSSIC